MKLSKKRQILSLRKQELPSLNWESNQGRNTIGEYEWVLVKGAIDSIREEVGDYEEAKELLSSYHLWDEETDSMDDHAITKLYMEYA